MCINYNFTTIVPDFAWSSPTPLCSISCACVKETVRQESRELVIRFAGFLPIVGSIWHEQTNPGRLFGTERKNGEYTS